MTEKEKKAIEDLKDILKYWQTIVDIEDDIEREIEMNCYSEEMPFKQLKIALNLIEKQQKEIKYIRDKNQDLVEENSTKDGDYEELKDNFNEYKANSIPKDKIRKLDNECFPRHKIGLLKGQRIMGTNECTYFAEKMLELLEEEQE